MVWLGACNGRWGNFDAHIIVERVDLYPVGEDTQFNACDGIQEYVGEEGVHVVFYANSLPGVPYLPGVLRLALQSLKVDGTLVVTDLRGRVGAVMDTTYYILEAYEAEGMGSMSRDTEEYGNNKTLVDVLCFTKSSHMDDMPLIELPTPATAETYAAVSDDYASDELPIIPSYTSETEVHDTCSYQRGTQTSIKYPGIYAVGVTNSIYIGGSIDVTSRIQTHVACKPGGCKALARIIQEDEDVPINANVVFGFNEIRSELVHLVTGDTDITVDNVDWMVHVAEQHALSALLTAGKGNSSEVTPLNRHISGFSQGYQAHASENGTIISYIKIQQN